MRPTELGVKIPAGKTPSPGSPSISRTGHTTSFAIPSCGFTFGSLKRFPHYEAEYKKTGYRLGPGIHNPTNYNIGIARMKNAPLYRPHSHVKGKIEDGYYISGNLLVYEDTFIPKYKLRTRNRRSPQLKDTPITNFEMATSNSTAKFSTSFRKSC